MSNNNSFQEKILESLKELKYEINNIKEQMISMEAQMQIGFNREHIINDIKNNTSFNNEETKSNIEESIPSKKNKHNRPAYFKKLFLEHRDEYMDKLFSQNLIDKYMENIDVVKKKNTTDKYNKIASLIYSECIKIDKTKNIENDEYKKYKDEFEKIYLHYKE